MWIICQETKIQSPIKIKFVKHFNVPPEIVSKLMGNKLFRVIARFENNGNVSRAKKLRHVLRQRFY